MMRLTVDFDGHRLSDLFTVSQVVRPLMGPPTPETVQVPGMDGRMWRGTRRDQSEVEMTLVAFGEDYGRVMDSMRKLAGWLAVDEPKRLALGDEGGLWRLAVPSGDFDVEMISPTSAKVDLTFMVPEGCMHGPRTSNTVYFSSGGVGRINIDGTLPTPVVMKGTGNGGSAVTITDETTGEHFTVRMPTGVMQGLVVDAETRTCTVGGSASMITLDSSWPIFAPGLHEIRATNMYFATFEYESRWA